MKPDFTSIANNFIKTIRQVLFPGHCLKCKAIISPLAPDNVKGASCRFEDTFCPDCRGSGVKVIQAPMCTFCGSPFDNQNARNHVCESCLTYPLKLNKVRAHSRYDGILKEAIHLFKYQSELSLAKAFEKMVSEVFKGEYLSQPPDIIMPVPLHKTRLKKRGFNQAYILVRHLDQWFEKTHGKRSPWRLDTRTLVRNRKTMPQTGLDIEQRRKNLKNAFEVKNRAVIKDKYVLLIDDVFTTGATCNEAARQLISGGAVKVDALVIART